LVQTPRNASRNVGAEASEAAGLRDVRMTMV